MLLCKLSMQYEFNRRWGDFFRLEALKYYDGYEWLSLSRVQQRIDVTLNLLTRLIEGEWSLDNDRAKRLFI